MKNAKIIEEDCIGCGQCGMMVPEVFEVEDIAKVIVDHVDKDLVKDVEEAIEACPTGAITWEEVPKE